jgi:hypothetical protein
MGAGSGVAAGEGEMYGGLTEAEAAGPGHIEGAAPGIGAGPAAPGIESVGRGMDTGAKPNPALVEAGAAPMAVGDAEGEPGAAPGPAGGLALAEPAGGVNGGGTGTRNGLSHFGQCWTCPARWSAT